MAIPILTTKLYMPKPRIDLVARSRLLALITEKMQRGAGLTLVSAPAGFGKTTLASQWLSDSRQAAAWLSLDEEDNDPTRFLGYLIAALQSLDPGLGQAALSDLQSPQPPALESLLVMLLNDLAGFPKPFALVLDDYHVITNPTIHAGLTFLLDHRPPHMHLIITSRTDPPLSLARLRGRGQMIELRQADLRFTPAEAALFLDRVMGLSLSPEDVAALEARTEGWIAGLQLAALSMQGITDLSGFIQSFSGSHRHIVDYLAGEVLHRQPEEVQTFLLQTSILNRLTGPLCEAVIGREAEERRSENYVSPLPSYPAALLSTSASGQELLAYLEAANLFIIPLDHERRWYRYHHLFADLLQGRLQQAQPPDRVVELHRRAAAWYEDNGWVDEAVPHAVKGNDTERLARLVAANGPALLTQGRVVTLESWLDALPEEAIYAWPELCLSQAWRWLLRRRLQAIEPYLHAAEQSIGAAGPDQQAAWRGEISAIRAFITSEQGDFEQAVSLARRALELLPERDAFARGSSALALGHALFALGDTGPAAAALTESVVLSRAANNALGALYSLGTLIVLLGLQGQLRRIEQTLQQAIEWTAGHHWQQLPPAGVLYLRLGDLRREQNDLATAEQLLNQAFELALSGAPIIAARAAAFLARVKQTQGDTTAAEAAWQQVARLSHGWETGQEVAYFAAYRARLELLRDNLAAAVAWANQLPAWEPDETLNYFREFELVTLGRVRLAQGLAQPAGPHLAETLALLAWLRRQAEAAGRRGIVIETLILEALARSAQSDPAQALTALAGALTLAEPEGYARLFLDEGARLAALLAPLPPTPYGDRLLAAFEAEEQERGGEGEKISPPAPPPSRSAGLVEPLSERELEVLRLLAEGYSNREIAKKLIFTVATAKKHAENIYSKLGVHSRTQAIARARELNLL